MFAPSGRVVRTMRFAWKEDGVTLRKSGHSIIVHVRQDSESRRTFLRFVKRNSMEYNPVKGAAIACEDDTYNRRTGELRKQHEESSEVCWTFAVIGTKETLRALSSHPSVESWEFAVSVRVPFVAGGSASGEANDRAERLRRGTRDEREAHNERKRLNRIPETSAQSPYAEDRERWAHGVADMLVAPLVTLADGKNGEELDEHLLSKIHSRVKQYAFKTGTHPLSLSVIPGISD